MEKSLLWSLSLYRANGHGKCNGKLTKTFIAELALSISVKLAKSRMTEKGQAINLLLFLAF